VPMFIIQEKNIREVIRQSLGLRKSSCHYDRRRLRNMETTIFTLKAFLQTSLKSGHEECVQVSAARHGKCRNECAAPGKCRNERAALAPWACCNGVCGF
jgi:hypothetical protein